MIASRAPKRSDRSRESAAEPGMTVSYGHRTNDASAAPDFPAMVEPEGRSFDVDMSGNRGRRMDRDEVVDNDIVVKARWRQDDHVGLIVVELPTYSGPFPDERPFAERRAGRNGERARTGHRYGMRALNDGHARRSRRIAG
jgi:hypothetical protein